VENERSCNLAGMKGSPGIAGTATTHLEPPSLTRTNVLGDVSHVSLLPFARVREDSVLRPLDSLYEGQDIEIGEKQSSINSRNHCIEPVASIPTRIELRSAE
jgi:hypothetical protein